MGEKRESLQDKKSTYGEVNVNEKLTWTGQGFFEVLCDFFKWFEEFEAIVFVKSNCRRKCLLSK